MINRIHYALILMLLVLFWPVGLAVAMPVAVGAGLVWAITKLRR